MPSTETAAIEETVRELIAEFAYLDDETSNDDRLLLDSLDIAALLEVIEDTYGADVAAALAAPDIQTVRTIALALVRAQEGL